MGKPALKLEPAFRSRLEKKIADQLTAAGIDWGYETRTVKVAIPARISRYIPDFDCGPILIEGKGRFGHNKSDSDAAKAREKLALVKEQHPELDIRLIFQDASKPIYKGSKTTYAKWADTHGFKWSDKGLVPYTWIKEIREWAYEHRELSTSDATSKNCSASPRKARKDHARKGRRGLRHSPSRGAHLRAA